MEIRIEQLKAYDLGKMHETIIPMLEKAVEHTDGEYDVADIIEAISSGQQGCLGIFQELKLIGIYTVMLINYPQRRLLRIVTMGGLPVEYWAATEQTLTEYARGHQCDGIEFWCRPGVSKIVKKSFGFEHQYDVLIRPVEE